MSPSSSRPSLGCLKYGCIVALLIATVLGGALYFYVKYAIRNAIETYTQPTAVPVAADGTSEEVRAKAKGDALATVLALREAISTPAGLSSETPSLSENKPSAKKEFVLTPLEIEELLRAMLPNLFTAGTFALRGEGDALSADFSLSVRNLASLWEAFSSFALSADDRFLNGHITAGGQIISGRPKISVRELVLAGDTFPEMGRTSAAASIEGFLKSMFAGEVESTHRVDYSRIQEVKVVNGGLSIIVQ